MKETQHTSASPESRSPLRPDPSTAQGRSRLVLVLGMIGFGVGSLLDAKAVVWGSVTLVAIAFALNTAGKLVHYRELEIPHEKRVALATSWVLLSVAVVGLVADYAYFLYGPGSGDFFWPLGLVGLGLAVFHRKAQTEYLDDVDGPD